MNTTDKFFKQEENPGIETETCVVCGAPATTWAGHIHRKRTSTKYPQRTASAGFCETCYDTHGNEHENCPKWCKYGTGGVPVVSKVTSYHPW